MGEKRKERSKLNDHSPDPVTSVYCHHLLRPSTVIDARLLTFTLVQVVIGGFPHPIRGESQTWKFNKHHIWMLAVDIIVVIRSGVITVR